jgi:hypothetical protein
MKTTKITARQLRHLLFTIDNQDMTIRDLRTILFDAEQDTPYSIEDLGSWANAVDMGRRIRREQSEERTLNAMARDWYK